MRRILTGIVAGGFLAFAIVFAVQYYVSILWPLPAGVDPNTPSGAQGMAEHMATTAKAAIVAGWCLGSLAGGALAARLAHRRLAAWLVAAIVVTRACTTVADVARPGWMLAAALVLPWVCAWIVLGAARRRRY